MSAGEVSSVDDDVVEDKHRLASCNNLVGPVNLGGAELPYFAAFNWTQSRAPKMTTCLTLLCPNQVHHGEIYNPK
jgi:hypothetical protein